MPTRKNNRGKSASGSTHSGGSMNARGGVGGKRSGNKRGSNNPNAGGRGQRSRGDKND